MIFWKNSGSPKIKFSVESASGYCACCGISIKEGVKVKDVAGSALGRQHEMMPHGSHVCHGCAWMCEESTQKNRNVFAISSEIYWPMIGGDMATEERPTWKKLLEKAVTYAPETQVMGVLTTDPKPRLWPIAQACTVEDFGLYVHCPDYDLSNFVRFDLNECLSISDKVSEILTLGYSKRACYFGLLSDMKKAQKEPQLAIKNERELSELRRSPAFVPALLIASKSN